MRMKNRSFDLKLKKLKIFQVDQLNIFSLSLPPSLSHLMTAHDQTKSPETTKNLSLVIGVKLNHTIRTPRPRGASCVCVLAHHHPERRREREAENAGKAVLVFGACSLVTGRVELGTRVHDHGADPAERKRAETVWTVGEFWNKLVMVRLFGVNL